MKLRLFIFMLCACFSLNLSAQKKKDKEAAEIQYKYEMEASNSTARNNKFCIVKVWSYGKKEDDTRKMCMRNAVHGIIFKGYINNVPKVVLSGGRYDKLMEKLDKKAEAIGFAVYLGEIEKYIKDDIRFDADVLLTYTDADCAQDVFKKATELRSSGKSVRVQKTEGKVRYGEILRSEDVSL